MKWLWRDMKLSALIGSSLVLANAARVNGDAAPATATPTVATATAAVAMPSGVVNGVDYSRLSKMMAHLAPEKEDNLVPYHQPPPVVFNASNSGIEARAGGMKVLIVGDSMTQGQEGDYTWRYRISQWFASQNIAVDFVGPYKGTRQPPDAAPPKAPPLKGQDTTDNRIIADGGYAAGASFDSDHFAIWGRACAQDVGLIKDVVANSQPDLMLVMLGFNDLGWFYSDDVGLLNNMGTFISNARSGKADVKIALANVPQRTSLGRQDLPDKTDKYNAALPNAISNWSTDQSPIKLVKLRENYNCELNGCPAGYDGLHPNALGEFQIARAFSLTLVNDMGIGSAALTIPGNVPTRPVPVPSNFQVSTSPQGVTATWDKVYGSYGYDVRTRISGVTDWAVGHIPANRFDTQYPLDNSTYDIQVRSTCGDGCAGDWTAVGSAVARPQTAKGPKLVSMKDLGSGSLEIAWEASTGPYSDTVFEYSVLFWDQTQPCSWIGGYGFKSSPAVLDDLVDGHRYFLAITAWNANGEGFPNTLPDRIIGAGMPATVGKPTIKAIDGFTIHMTWDAVPGAAGYYVWTRNINNSSDISAKQPWVQSGTCSDQGWLAPGVQNFEFCLQAFNGGDESPKGPCSVAPTPVKGDSVPSCVPTATGQATGCGFSNIPTFTNDQPPPTSKPMHDKPPPTASSSVLTPTDSKRPWQTVDCGNNAVTNVNRESGSDFWAALDVNKAWSDATTFFITDKGRPASEEFTEDLAMYFNVTTNNYKCRTLQYGNDPACKIPIGCKDANSPAGWAIMNSIVGIERVLSNLASAITDTEASVSDQVNSVVSTFGNIPDGHLDAILGIVSLGLGFLGTPAFGDIIKGLNNFKETAGDTVAAIKDASTNMAGQAISLVKNGEADAPTSVAEGNTLKQNVQGIIRVWELALKEYAAKLFDGTPESITGILHLIVDGTMFNTASVATIDLQAQVERAIFPQLIAQAWVLGKSPPFLLDTGDSCKAGDPPPKKTPAPKEGYACVNGKVYYLTSTPGTYYTNPNCAQHPVTQCTPTGYQNLPGIKSLDGKAFGGVTLQDFAEGSVNTYNGNGQKNGVTTPPDFAQTIVGQIYDNPGAALRIGGVFNIPVCKDGTAQANWKEGRTGAANYPCS